MDNNAVCDVVSKSTVRIKMHDDIMMTLTNIDMFLIRKRISFLWTLGRLLGTNTQVKMTLLRFLKVLLLL